jgi:glycosyltransferase involved in cell wall biosynthesis
MKVLWLASWYPGKTHATNGDFTERQAKAVSLLVPVTVLFVTKDESLAAGSAVMDKTVDGNLTVYRVYYGRSAWAGWLEKLLSLRRFAQLQRKYIRLILAEQGKPALVHVQVAMKAGLGALYLKKKYNIPYVVTEHWTGYYPQSSDSLYSRDIVFRMLNKRILKGAAAFLPVSAHLGQTVNEHFVKKTFAVIPNVVDTSLFFYKPGMEEKWVHFKLSLAGEDTSQGSQPWPVSPPTTTRTSCDNLKCARQKFRFIHPSYLNYQKNPEGIIAACKIAAEAGCAFELLFVGREDAALAAAAQKAGLLNSVVSFMPEQAYHQVAKLMQDSSALLLFSRFENLPCVVLEALCCGLPVISTHVGGLPEVIDNTNGILVQSEDIAGLATAMQQMVHDYTAYNRAAIAQQAVEQFSYHAVAGEIIQVYKTVGAAI